MQILPIAKNKSADDKKSLSTINGLPEAAKQNELQLEGYDEIYRSAKYAFQKVRDNRVDKSDENSDFIITLSQLQKLDTAFRTLSEFQGKLHHSNKQIKKVIEDERALTASRRQEEKLDRNNKWRSFLLRMGTTLGTVVLTIGLLNIAIAWDLHLPRILMPDPTYKSATTQATLINATNEAQSQSITPKPEQQ